MPHPVGKQVGSWPAVRDGDMEPSSPPPPAVRAAPHGTESGLSWGFAGVMLLPPGYAGLIHAHVRAAYSDRQVSVRFSVPCEQGYRLSDLRKFIALCEQAGLDDQAVVYARLMGWRGRVKTLSAEWPDPQEKPARVVSD
jgi:hypothetical protein